MLSRFIVENYRNVTADVTLEPCTVVIGPNNGGKSNLLRAMRFATDGVVAGAEDWGQVVRDHGGPALPRWGAALDSVRLQWRFDDPPKEVRIRLERKLGHLTAVIERAKRLLDLPDSPTDSEGFLLRSFVDEDVVQLAVAHGADASKTLRAHFTDLGYLQLAALHAPTAKAASMSVRGAPRLAPDASNLVAWLKEQQNHTDGLDAVRAAIEPLLPGLKRIFVRDVDGQAMWVELVLAVRPDRAVPLADLSDGTLVALILASLLHGPLSPRILLLDEPDLHLHPAWIRTVASWFEAPGVGRQVILATHSSDLLDALTPAFREGRVALLVAGADGVVQRFEPARLQLFFDQGYELGDLYRTGEPELGGWPW